MQNNIVKNIFYLFFPLLCGSLVGLLISNSMDYGIINKPLLSPPGFIFPIVWSILYLLLGLSYYLYKKNSNDNLTLDKVYYVGLLVNLLWSFLLCSKMAFIYYILDTLITRTRYLSYVFIFQKL